MFIFDEGNAEQLPHLKPILMTMRLKLNYKLKWPYLVLKTEMKHLVQYGNKWRTEQFN